MVYLIVSAEQGKLSWHGDEDADAEGEAEAEAEQEIKRQEKKEIDSKMETTKGGTDTTNFTLILLVVIWIT